MRKKIARIQLHATYKMERLDFILNVFYAI